MNRDRIKYAVCRDAGYADGSREHSIASVATGHALDVWPAPMATVAEACEYASFTQKWQKQQRRLREREENRVFRETRDRTIKTIRQNPEAYGFAGIMGMIVLIFQIGSIVWPIIRALFDMRYSGEDDTIQLVAGEKR